VFQLRPHCVSDPIRRQDGASPNAKRVPTWLRDVHDLRDPGGTRVKDDDFANPVVGRTHGFTFGTQGIGDD
jgi:hypothetical protein